MKVDKDLKLRDLLKMSGRVAKVLENYNLECAGCRGNEHDTVERVAVNNGLDLDKFLSELNDAVNG